MVTKEVKKYMGMLDGNKGYIAGIAWMLFGIAGLLLGQMDSQQAVQNILGGFTIIAGRSALKKQEEK